MAEIAEKHLEERQEQASGSDYELQNDKTNNTVSTGFDPEDDPNFRFGFTRTLVFLGLSFSFFGDNILLSCVSSALSHINEDLGPSTSSVWIISANYTVVSITSPFVGRISDIFGRRYLIILGNVLCCIGCVVSATAHTMTALLVGAVILGFGASFDLLSWAGVGEIVPKRHRPVCVGMFEACQTPVSIIGTLVGLSLTEHTTLGWRNIYWVSFAFHGAAIPILLFFYHPVNQYIKEKGKTRWDQVKRLDWIGFVLFTIGLCLFLTGLSFGGGKFPWKSAGTLAPLIVGIVFIIITGVYEALANSPYNMFPHAIMQDFRGFTLICAVGFLSGILYYSSLIIWPLQVSALYATTTVKIGEYGMCYGWGALLGSVVAGFIIEKVNQARITLTAITLFLTIVIGTSAIVGPNTEIASSALSVCVGIGVSSVSVVINSMIQLRVPHQYIGVAMGLVTVFRYVGGSVGTTVYEVILTNQLTDNLGTNIAAALAKAGLPVADIPAVAEALATGDATSPALALASSAALAAGAMAIKLTYAHAFKIIYLVSIAFGTVGTICAAFTRNVGEFLTNKLDVILDEQAHLGLHDVQKGGHLLDEDGNEITNHTRGTVPGAEDV